MNFLPEELSTFTAFQLEILNRRISEKMTFMEMQAEFGFKSNQAIINFITRTLLGNPISQEDNEGRLPLVGKVPALMFYNRAMERAVHNNCLKVNTAINTLEQVLADYLYHSYVNAHQLGCPFIAAKLIEKLNEIEISSSWFTMFCRKNGLILLNPESLEVLRNKYCHQNVMLQFHTMLSNTIHQVPYLLFNADETSSTFNKKGKVVVPVGRRALSEDSIQFGHVTMLCTTNAAGMSFKPFIILPMLQRLPAELLDFEDKAQFASSPSGWITSKLFLAWVVFFIHSLEAYKCRIASTLARLNAMQAPTYLFLDGHKSRLNSEALELLFIHNIHVIIFPAHTTHVAQPFDVSLAAPLKASIKKFGETFTSAMTKRMNGYNQTAKQRYFIIHTLISAWESVATYRNIQSGWNKTGIFPLDYSPLRDNILIRQSNANEQIPVQRGVAINGLLITTPEKRLEIARRYYNNPNLNSVPIPNHEIVINSLMHGDQLLLTPPPPYPMMLLYRFY